MRWRLLFHESGPGIVYTKGPKNIVADALSRLPKQDDIVHDVDAVFQFVRVDENIFPLQLKEIQSYQAKDRDLRQKIKNNPVHSQKETVEQVNIVTYTNRICSQAVMVKNHQMASPLPVSSRRHQDAQDHGINPLLGKDGCRINSVGYCMY